MFCYLKYYSLIYFICFLLFPYFFFHLLFNHICYQTKTHRRIIFTLFHSSAVLQPDFQKFYKSLIKNKGGFITYYYLRIKIVSFFGSLLRTTTPLYLFIFNIHFINVLCHLFVIVTLQNLMRSIQNIFCYFYHLIKLTIILLYRMTIPLYVKTQEFYVILYKSF